MARAGQRSAALQVGVATLLAGLVSLALIPKSGADVYDTFVAFQGKGTASARFFFNDNPRKNVAWLFSTPPINASIQWGIQDVPQLNRECISIAFHPIADCKRNPSVTFQRPLPITSSSFTNWTLATAKDLPGSIKCWTGLPCGLRSTSQGDDGLGMRSSTSILPTMLSIKPCVAAAFSRDQ
ncbi:unnamed protein product [Closterium sp. Yama58-4]|nr:unnamed protein product [Closterium sp. Yama58-4]